MVSMSTRSAPAAAPARTTWAYRATASSKSRSPMGFKSLPVGPMSRATNTSGRGSASLASQARRTPAVTSSSRSN